MFGPTISELRAGVATYVAAFDASAVTAADAVLVVDEAARIEKMAATLKALAAARAAESDLLERDGDAGPAHALARRTGTSVSKAAEALRTGRRLGSQPDLDTAARRGDVSAEQAAAISEAVAADPGAASRLVGSARTSSLHELRTECERTKAAADGDAEERHRRIHAARYARRRSCPDGSGEITVRNTRDVIAEMWAVISGYANQAFDHSRLAGGHEPAEAYAADGVLAMSRAAGHVAGGMSGRSAASGPSGAAGGEAASDGGRAGTAGPDSAHAGAPDDDACGDSSDPVPAGEGVTDSGVGADGATGDDGANGSGADLGRAAGADVGQAAHAPPATAVPDEPGADVGQGAHAPPAAAAPDEAGAGVEHGAHTPQAAAPDEAGAGVEGAHTPQALAVPADEPRVSAGNGVLPGLGIDAHAARPAPEPVAPASGSPPGRVRSPVPTRIVVRVDWPALARGLVAGDEVCEITGIGPVPVSVVRAMMATGDAFLAAVVTKGVDVVSVTHLGRRATVYQSTALDWTSPTCQVLGCDAVARLETDHRVDWADTHMTWLEWLERLCECHHDKKTYDGWALVAGTGKRAMVPPGDPRHPRNQTG